MDTLSVVVPTYKSADNLLTLVNRLKQVNVDEIIIVNDCSPDNTLEVLRQIKGIKVISFSRNFGQQLATTAGLKYATGDAVIVMDDDLQDPPEMIPKMVLEWKQGYDVVYAIRNRQDHLLKKLAYKIFYWLFNKVSYINIPIDAGDFSLMDRKVVDAINSMSEQNRFVRGMRSWVGFKQIGIAYNRPKRKGKSSYHPLKAMQLILYGLLAFSNMPLYFSLFAGMVILTISLIYRDRIFFLAGIQLISIGILGKYLVRINDEVKQRPLYIINEVFET